MLSTDDPQSHADKDSNQIKKYQCILPSEALITRNFKEFCRMIKDRLTDVKHKVLYLIEKIEYERNILKTNAGELTERDKTTIRNYIGRLELELDKWTKVRMRLQKLVSSEKRLMKVFMNRKII